jgi:hypothetical protein
MPKVSRRRPRRRLFLAGLKRARNVRTNVHRNLLHRATPTGPGEEEVNAVSTGGGRRQSQAVAALRRGG